MGGYELPHAVLMMIPEAWENHESMPLPNRAFYRYHASLMEPWDGPASIAFTDGTVIGAVLDRNGLRPSRYWVTADDLVIMASEVGVLDVDPAKVVQKGRLQPGRMFLVDTAEGRIVDDDEIKAAPGRRPALRAVARRAASSTSTSCPYRAHELRPHAAVVQRQQVFGYTTEELKILIEPMARTGAEPIGSMGTDTPIAVLSVAAPAAVRLLHPAVRPGHQPAARRHPRGAGHLARRHHRSRGQPARPRSARRAARSTCRVRSSTTTSWPSSPHIHTYDDMDDFHTTDPAVPVPGGRRRRRPAPGRSTSCAAQASEAIESGANILILSDRNCSRRAGADPVAAGRVGRAPPPHPREDPHPGRARRRVRRRPRGAPHGAADRLRRRGHQPLPRLRDDRGPDRRAA